MSSQGQHQDSQPPRAGQQQPGEPQQQGGQRPPAPGHPRQQQDGGKSRQPDEAGRGGERRETNLDDDSGSGTPER